MYNMYYSYYVQYVLRKVRARGLETYILYIMIIMYVYILYIKIMYNTYYIKCAVKCVDLVCQQYILYKYVYIHNNYVCIHIVHIDDYVCIHICMYTYCTYDIMYVICLIRGATYYVLYVCLFFVVITSA